MSPAQVLAHEAQSRELFARSVQTLHGGSANSKLNALDVSYLPGIRKDDVANWPQTLSVFLCAVLSKRYPHPSSAIISLLAGIDKIDAVFTSFIGTLEGIVKSGPVCASSGILVLGLLLTESSGNAEQSHRSPAFSHGRSLPDDATDIHDSERSLSGRHEGLTP